jgi:hypothetical protein
MQVTIQAGTRDFRAEKFPRHRQQVVKRHQKMSAQTDGSPTAVHRRLQMVRRMQAIHRVRAMFPFPHGDTPDAIPSRQGAHPFRACCNLRAHRRRCLGILMQTKSHLFLLSLSLANLPLPVTHHAQKTVASEKIESNHPGGDSC